MKIKFLTRQILKQMEKKSMGGVFAGNFSTIAKTLGVTRQTVRNHVKILAAEGYLSKVDRLYFLEGKEIKSDL